MKTLLAALLVATSAVPASANLLRNPSFNSGFTTYWTGVPLIYGPAGPADAPAGAPGGYSAAMGCTRASALTSNGCAISQSITTVIGQSYDISFWAYNGNATITDPTKQEFKVLFGATNLGVTDYGLSKVWTQFTMTAVATATSTLFKVYGRNDASTMYLDGFSIEESASPVPEPAMLGLFGLGAIGLGLSRRRKA